jgi:preprotein translocase subunit YajC
MDPLLIIFAAFAVFAAFTFFTSRRQKRAMQATIDLHDSLRIGDRVHTVAGLQATITDITDDTVDLEIAPGVVTTWMKLAIRDRIEPETPATDADEADLDDDAGVAALDADPGAAGLDADPGAAGLDADVDPERLTKE